MTEEINRALKPILHGMERVTTDSEVVGAVAYTVDVSYNDDRGLVTFTGTMFGAPGPVFMQMDGLTEPVEVHQPERFGVRFNDDWIRSFYR